MTESEAIEYLTAYLECESRRSRIESCNNNCNECELCYLQGTAKQHLEGIKIAIQALEKVQQYRAIGTPEELQDMRSNYFEALSDWRQYRKIGTLEECQTALEKRIPKKVKNSGERIPFEWYCPNCGELLCDDGYKDTDIKYCDNCGQMIDWSDEI